MALITYLTRIQFDFGAIKLLEAELQLLGMRRPLIVTDKGIVAAGIWDRVKANLPGNMPIAMYDQTPENPTEAAMREALAIYRDQKCDGIIAIGGGSSMDLAKAVGLMATHPGDSLLPYAVVEGDWGLGKGIHVEPVIYPRPGYYYTPPPVGRYFPGGGAAPSLGRREIDTPPRQLPRSESFHRSWSAGSDPVAADAVPTNPPPVIVAPQIGEQPHRWQQPHARPPRGFYPKAD